MNKTTQSIISDRQTKIGKILIAIFLFNGLLSNFLPQVLGSGFGTIAVDIFTIVILILSLLLVFQGSSIKKYYILAIIYASLLAIILFVKMFADTNSFSERILGWRNYILYAAPALIFYFLKVDIDKTIRFLSQICGLICIFAISQYLFRNIYPESLMRLNVEQNTFEFYGLNIARVNGLVGNPIIFTAFSVISTLINFNIFSKNRERIFLLFTLSSYVSLLLTFSRAAWIIGTATIIFNILIIYKIKIQNVMAISIATVLIFGSAYYLTVNNQDSFVYKRVFSQEASTQGSNEERSRQLLLAYESINKNPMLGVGLGTQGGSANINDVIITDGWIPQLFLEFGIPIGLLYLFLNIFLVIFALNMKNVSQNSRVLAATLASSFIYFLLTSFINSAFNGKTVYLLYFSIIGLCLNSTIRGKARRDS